MSRAFGITILVLLSAVLVVAAFLGGTVFGHLTQLDLSAFGIERAVDSDLGEKVEEIEGLLENGALDPSNEESRTAGAINGLLDALDDPYALYFDPDHFKYFNEQNDGEFFGIGVTITEREGIVFVVSVIEGTPAEEVGLLPDDEVRIIDGVEREIWSLEEVVQRIRGPEGTVVNVTIFRPETEETLELGITRARIEIPNVVGRMETDEIGYLSLMSFNQRSAPDLRDELNALIDQGAKGIVLDLRNNPGGLLDASVDVASLFIQDGVIVRVESRSEGSTAHRARAGTATDVELAVLINGNSASASEIVAGALQDYDRAILVGENTFGKGSVQTVEKLSFGGGVKYTIAHYLTPKGRAIDGEGLAPDIDVVWDVEDMQGEDPVDPQLEAAISELESNL